MNKSGRATECHYFRFVKIWNNDNSLKINNHLNVGNKPFHLPYQKKMCNAGNFDTKIFNIVVFNNKRNSTSTRRFARTVVVRIQHHITVFLSIAGVMLQYPFGFYS